VVVAETVAALLIMWNGLYSGAEVVLENVLTK
jgi:hypothetical protein